MVLRGLGALIDWAAVLLVWVSVGILMPPSGAAGLFLDFFAGPNCRTRPAAT
jgi:hypothetical protein